MPRYHLKIMIFPKKEGGEIFLTWPIYPKCKNNHILLLTRSPKLTFRSGYSWSSHLGLILAQICLRSVLERYLDWLKYSSALVYFGSPIPPLYYQLPRLPLATCNIALILLKHVKNDVYFTVFKFWPTRYCRSCLDLFWLHTKSTFGALGTIIVSSQ